MSNFTATTQTLQHVAVPTVYSDSAGALRSHNNTKGTLNVSNVKMCFSVGYLDCFPHHKQQNGCCPRLPPTEQPNTEAFRKSILAITLKLYRMYMKRDKGSRTINSYLSVSRLHEIERVRESERRKETIKQCGLVSVYSAAIKTGPGARRQPGADLQPVFMPAGANG